MSYVFISLISAAADVQYIIMTMVAYGTTKYTLLNKQLITSSDHTSKVSFVMSTKEAIKFQVLRQLIFPYKKEKETSICHHFETEVIHLMDDEAVCYRCCKRSIKNEPERSLLGEKTSG